MRSNRKDIDKFLVSLDNFISKYYNHDEAIRYDFINIFKANKANAKKSLREGTQIQFKILDRLANKGSVKKEDAERHKSSGTIIQEVEKLTTRRKGAFIQKIAYSLEYKVVRDLSYAHIFYKMCLDNNRLFTYVNRYPDYLLNYGDDLKEFIIPADWEHNMDLVVH